MENGNIDRLMITGALIIAIIFFKLNNLNTNIGYLVLIIVLGYGMFDKLRKILK